MCYWALDRAGTRQPKHYVLCCGTLLCCCSLLTSPQARQRRQEKKAKYGQNCGRARWEPASCVLTVALCPLPPQAPFHQGLSCGYSTFLFRQNMHTEAEVWGAVSNSEDREKKEKARCVFQEHSYQQWGIRSHASCLFFTFCCFSSIPSTSQSPGKMCSDMDVQDLGGAVHGKGF